MTRSLLTEEQRAFLEASLPDFRHAQLDSTTPSFFSRIYAAWFDKWPPTEPDPVDAGGNDSDKGAKAGSSADGKKVLSRRDKDKNVSIKLR